MQLQVFQPPNVGLPHFCPGLPNMPAEVGLLPLPFTLLLFLFALVLKGVILSEAKDPSAAHLFNAASSFSTTKRRAAPLLPWFAEYAGRSGSVAFAFYFALVLICSCS